MRRFLTGQPLFGHQPNGQLLAAGAPAAHADKCFGQLATVGDVRYKAHELVFPSPINHWSKTNTHFHLLTTYLNITKSYNLQPFSPALHASPDPWERGTTPLPLLECDLADNAPWPLHTPLTIRANKISTTEDHLIAFMDGSEKDSRAGNAAVILTNPPTVLKEHTPHKQNNKSSEIYAAIMVLRATPNHITDSQVTIATPKQKNSPSIGPLLLQRLISKHSAPTTFHHIPSHVQDKLSTNRAKWTAYLMTLRLPIATREAIEWNKAADEAAKQAVDLPTPILDSLAANASHIFIATLQNGNLCQSLLSH